MKIAIFKRKTALAFILGLLSGVFFQQASGWSLFGGGKDIKLSGITQKKEYCLNPYTSITLVCSANVLVRPALEGQKGRVEIKTDEALLPHIKIRVNSNNTLEIKADNLSYSSCTIEIICYVDQLEEVVISGSGKVKMDDELWEKHTKNKINNVRLSIAGSGSIHLSCLDVTKKLTTDISGSGSIVVKGVAASYEAKVSGSGKANAYELLATDATVIISGSGEAKVFASHTLNIIISVNGNCWYRGNPKNIHEKISGSGKIRKES